MTVRVEADFQPTLRRWIGFQTSFKRTLSQMVQNTTDVALALTALSGPAAGVFYAMALWRLGADLSWTGDFVISGGLFSHWQVWLALGALVQFSGRVLERRLRVAYRAVRSHRNSHVSGL